MFCLNVNVCELVMIEKSFMLVLMILLFELSVLASFGKIFYAKDVESFMMFV